MERVSQGSKHAFEVLQQQQSLNGQRLKGLLNQTRRRQFEINAAPLEALEILADAQAVKLLPDEKRSSDAKMLVGQTVLRGPIRVKILFPVSLFTTTIN